MNFPKIKGLKLPWQKEESYNVLLSKHGKVTPNIAKGEVSQFVHQIDFIPPKEKDIGSEVEPGMRKVLKAVRRVFDKLQFDFYLFTKNRMLKIDFEKLVESKELEIK